MRTINFDYPEGDYVVLANPEIEDDGDEIVLVSLVTGEKKVWNYSTNAWIKIGYAGISLLEGVEEYEAKEEVEYGE